MLTDQTLKTSSLGVRLAVHGLRALFFSLSKIFPKPVGWMALRVFLSPPRARLSRWEKVFAEKGKVHLLKVGEKQLRLLEHGTGSRRILLVHGWGSRGTHLGSYAEALVADDCTVYSLDGPAHGDSSGRSTDMIEYAQAISETCKFVGGVHAIVAHSFGAGCTLLSIKQHNLNPPRLVLISCFSDAIYITDRFAEFFRISSSAIREMRNLLEHRHRNRWRWEDLAPRYLIGTHKNPVLIIHDANDSEVPFSHAISLNSQAEDSKIHTTTLQGHRKILRDASGIEATVNFLRN